MTTDWQIVSKNPYQPPLAPTGSQLDDSITERLRQLRKARKRWARRCWWIGILSISSGLLGFNLSQFLYDKHGSRVWTTSIDIVSISLIAIGGLTIAMGPIAWYWFRIKPVEDPERR